MKSQIHSLHFPILDSRLRETVNGPGFMSIFQCAFVVHPALFEFYTVSVSVLI
jgi:hypothetical protein